MSEALALIKSLVFAGLMVPVITAAMIVAIYGIGELFNIISSIGPNSKHTTE